MDPLSDVISLLKVESILSSRMETAGPWGMRFPAYRHIVFGGILEGSRWLWIEGLLEPVKLEQGDFFLLTNGMPYCVATDLGTDLVDGFTVLAENTGEDGITRYGQGEMKTAGAGGRFTFDDETSDLLLGFLPPLIHVRADSRNWQPLHSAHDLIRFETEKLRPGAAALAGSLANIVLVNMLRVYLASAPHPAGWLGALADHKIGPALGRMHKDIARRWKVEDLASEVGMSRTSFAERFKAFVGMPPLDYLTRWRMTIAKNALRTNDDSLADIANVIGYASETAFSLAFKRRFGESPGRYRSQLRRPRRSLDQSRRNFLGFGLTNP